MCPIPQVAGIGYDHNPLLTCPCHFGCFFAPVSRQRLLPGYFWEWTACFWVPGRLCSFGPGWRERLLGGPGDPCTQQSLKSSQRLFCGPTQEFGANWILYLSSRKSPYSPKTAGYLFPYEIDRLLSLMLIWTSEKGSLTFPPWFNQRPGPWLLWGLLSWIKYKSLLCQQDVGTWATLTLSAIVGFTVSAEGRQGVSEGLKNSYILGGKR